MTNREIGNIVRNKIKNAGFKRNDVSVRVSDAGCETVVKVYVKNPVIPIYRITELVKPFSYVERDRSGDILSGGNTFVFCEYEYGIFDEMIQEYMNQAEEFMRSEAYDHCFGTVAENGDLKLKMFHDVNESGKYEWQLLQTRNGKIMYGCPNFWLRTTNELALALWRFYNVGTIFVHERYE